MTEREVAETAIARVAAETVVSIAWRERAGHGSLKRELADLIRISGAVRSNMVALRDLLTEALSDGN